MEGWKSVSGYRIGSETADTAAPLTSFLYSKIPISFTIWWRATALESGMGEPVEDGLSCSGFCIDKGYSSCKMIFTVRE